MLTNLDPGIHDMTGASIQDVIHELQFGHAVVTWANYDWNANPSGQNDYHVMTIVGYRNGQFLIADPYSYSRRVYWVNQGIWNYVNKNEHANGWNLPTGMNLTV